MKARASKEIQIKLEFRLNEEEARILMHMLQNPIEQGCEECCMDDEPLEQEAIRCELFKALRNELKGI